MNIVATRNRPQTIASSRLLGTVDAVRTVAFIGGCGLLFWQYDLAPVDWLFGIGIVASILLWLRGRQAFDLAWPQPLLAAFLGVTAVVTAVAGGSSRFLVTTIFLVLGSLALTSVLRGNERRRQATEMAIMVGGALTVGTILIGVVSRQFDWAFLDFLNREYLQSQGLFKDPNVAGGFVAIVYPLAAAWAMRRPRYRMRLVLLVTAVFAFGVVFSFSPMALAMFVIGYLGVAIALWIFHERRLLAALVAATVASLVLIVALVGIDKIPLYRYDPIQGYDENGRLVVWGFALQMFREAPLGTGAGSFDARSLAMFSSIIDPPAPPLTVTPSADNFYLRAAVETGAIGFLALLAYLALLLASATKRSSRVSWQWPLAFALVLIAGLTIDTVHWRGLWIYVAVIAAAIGPQQAARSRRPGRPR